MIFYLLFHYLCQYYRVTKHFNDIQIKNIESSHIKKNWKEINFEEYKNTFYIILRMDSILTAYTTANIIHANILCMHFLNIRIKLNFIINCALVI